MSSKQRMEELIKIINQADKEYYTDNSPSLSDKEYDDYYNELLELEKTNKPLPNSPTQKVSGQELSTELKKVQHKHPILSLNKTKDINEMKKYANNKPQVVSWKLDGISLVLEYNNGKLEDMVTRGGGTVGESVIHNLKLFRNIPTEISTKDNIFIRGEALIDYKTFKEINTDNQYRNPRNLTSGLVRSKYSTLENKISFVAYELLGHTQPYFEDQLTELKDLGFQTVEYKKTDNDQELEIAIADFTERSQDYQFPVDGLVVRYNSTQRSQELGITAHSPRYSMALKWADELYETTLRDIHWSIARTGAITPVAIFDPVEIDGTVVSRASLHNVSILKGLKLGIGDRIQVYKANMIIPQIYQSLDKTDNIEIATTCPSCGEDLELRNETGVETLHCVNENCPVKNIHRLVAFADSLDIDGLSHKTLELFTEEGLIKTPADIFRLKNHKEDILELPLFGETSYNKLINSIENARETTADKVLQSLGISLVAGRTVEKIFQDRNNIDTLLSITSSTKNNLKKEFDLGNVVSENIYNYFKDENNLEKFLDLLSELIIERVEESASDKLNGLNFVITGRLEEISRKDLTNRIKSLGGNVQSGVNSKTDFLVNNDINSNSSKNRKAKELNIPIISEEEVLKKLQ